MTDREAEREPSSLDDGTPGSQGEIEAGSEGDFARPEGDARPEDEPTDEGDEPAA